MGTTITGGVTTTGTITPSLFLSDPSQDPVLITTGAEGALGTIVGSAYGIAGSDNADWTITNRGTVQGTAGLGIVLNAGGRITNQGTASRIEGTTLGVSIAATGTISNDGTILGSGATGIILGGDDGSITNGSDTNTLASIGGGVFGVQIFGANAHVTNGGTIAGNFYSGLNLSHGGTVTNGSTLNSAAAITGNGSGIIAAAGAATVLNDGTIRGASGDGVKLAGGGRVANGAGSGTLAVIAGVYAGVEIRNGSGTVTNAGSISAGSFFGVLLVNGGSVDNAAGAGIYGRQIGVSIGGALGNVTNAGTITCDADTGILLAQGGTIANTGIAALIGGATFGVRINAGPADITNEGTIRAPGAAIAVYSTSGVAKLANTGTVAAANDAAYFAGAATVVNGSASAATASIVTFNIAAGYPSFALNIAGIGQVTNYGTMGVASGISGVVRLGQGGMLRNLGTASLIQGGARGVQAGGTAQVTNEGTIASFAGIELDQGGSIANAGTIAGFAHGVSSYDKFTRLTNSGLITSEQYGVLMNSGGVLRNGSPDNANATVSGTALGARMSGKSSRLINDGTIVSSHGTGVSLPLGGTIINGHGAVSPALISGNDYGIHVSPAGKSAATITNAGTIFGDLTGIVANGGTIINRGVIAGDVGIRTTGTLATTVTNSGYIDGSNGDAVEFGDADGNVFAMVRQSGFGGIVRGGTLTDTLQLMGPTPVRGIVSDVGSLFTDFENISVMDGGSWRLAGTSTLPNGGTIALDGSLEVTGSLTVNNTLNLLNSTGGLLGGLHIAPGGMIEVGSAGSGQPGRLTVDSDGHLTAAGYIAGRMAADTKVENNGTISVVAGDALHIRGKVTGTGTFELGHDSALFLTDITRIRHFLLPAAGGNEEISMLANTSIIPTISGFADADVIDIQGFAADPALTSFVGHVLTMVETGGRSVSLHMAGAGYTLASFQLTDDGANGTYITHV